MKHSKELTELIKKNAHLFWYSKESEKANLPIGMVLEFFINYASKEDTKALFDLMGIKNAASIFNKQIETWGNRSNYIPVFQNYFKLYFEKYAP